MGTSSLNDLDVARKVLRGKGVSDDTPLPEAIVEACENHAAVLKDRLHLALNYAEQALTALPDDHPTRAALTPVIERLSTTPTSGEYANAATTKEPR